MALAAAGFVAAVIHTSAAGAPRPSSAQAPATPLPPDYFETRVRPILAATCYDCHTDDEKGGLRLDSRAAVLTGGESGPAIVPGDPDNSLLIQAVRQLPGKPKMPKGKAPRLTDADIAVLADWIRAGAPWPATAATPAPGAAAPAKDKPITAEQRAFWSFQPLHATAAPAVARGDWPRTEIDRFVLAALERAGLAPVGTADKRTLIGAPRSTSPACRRPGRRSAPSRKTSRRTPSRRWSTGCSPRRSTASTGAGCGSTSRDTARTTIAASTRWGAATIPTPTPTCIATG